VAWSYDLLDDSEKGVLHRCSVFAGAFDLESACAVAGSDDDYVVLDLLDALVRKSLMVADRSSGRTRYSMLETIREFAEEQLVASDAAQEARVAHARHFSAKEADILALWDSPRQREASEWFAAELANLRTAFRWAADHGDLDIAAAIASYAGFLGYGVENFEPIAWVEELIEPAGAVDHPRLAFLYVIASMCYLTGRIEVAVGYCDAGQRAMRDGRGDVPFGFEAFLGGAYLGNGQPIRWVEWCRARLTQVRDTHALIRATLVLVLTIVGSCDDAIAAAPDLIDAAEATQNPFALGHALLAYAFACREAHPDRALAALHRGLAIAQDSGNRNNETNLAMTLARQEADLGDPLGALNHVTLAIRNYRDSGSNAVIRIPLAWLATFLDRLGRSDSAATIAGFAFSPLTAASFPELETAVAHLRDVLGDQAYESLAHKGETMSTAAMATYAYDQIDQARQRLRP
jgi:tetratricopeptide (TPR) repeat protein